MAKIRWPRPRGVWLLVGLLIVSLATIPVSVAAHASAPDVSGAIGYELDLPVPEGAVTVFHAEIEDHASGPLLVTGVRLDGLAHHPAPRLEHVALGTFADRPPLTYAGWPPHGYAGGPLRSLPATAHRGLIDVEFGLVGPSPGFWYTQGVTVTYRLDGVTRHVTSGPYSVLCVDRACPTWTSDPFP